MQAHSPQPSRPASIDDAIVSGILSGRLSPGTRLGEAQLATLFGVSRTLVREALMRLEARDIVHVRSRRGWFVVEPSAADAAMVYGARRALESGYLRGIESLGADGLARLRSHLAEERAAIAAGERQRLVYLMGDFHIRLAELSGNAILVEILRDLTARTILISMLYQSDFHARQSHDGHCRIVDALEVGDFAGAADLAILHLDEVEDGLDLTATRDPLAELRGSLALSSEAPERAASSSSP